MINNSRKGENEVKKKMAVFLIIAALGVGAAAFFSGANQNKKENDIKEVIVQSANTEEILQSVSAEGEVEITNEEEIYVSKSMRVDEVFVEENDTVKKGDKLLSFDPEQRNEIMRSIKTAKLKIREQKLSIEEYNFPVSTLEIDNAERDIADLLVEAKKYEEMMKLATLEKATLKIEHENNIEEYDVNQKLFELEGISLTELNESEEIKNSSAKNIELNDWEIKEYKIDLINIREKIKLAERTLADAKQTYEETILKNKNNIERAELTIEEYELEIESLKESLEKTVEYVVSPVNGTVTEVNAEENFLVNLEDSLMKISDINSQVITANVSSYDINKVQIGQDVRISSSSFEENEYIIGKVESISSLATTETGSGYEDVVVEVEIAFDSENTKLRPGYSVDLDIIIFNKDKTVTIPSFAVNKNKKGETYVMVLSNDNTVVEKIIEIGIKNTTRIEALNLNGREKIVMNSLGLRNGDKVKVVDKIISKVGEAPENNGGPGDGGGGPRQ